ncbi:MAG: GTP-binding protein [Candidatus Hodarchaeota archaeon]
MPDISLINAIVYTDFHDKLGPNPVYWYPSDLSENVRMLVSIKTVTLLSGSYGYTPESLIIIPFPSIKLKGLIRFIERGDRSRRGGVARSAITFLFKEADDIIFYKYIDYLNAIFRDSVQQLTELEEKNVENQNSFKELNVLRNKILNTLEELKNKEIELAKAEAFPEITASEEKVVDYKFKLVVLGDPGVGKTSTILRFTDNAFNRTYIPTMGVNITDKGFRVNSKMVELILWDIAGQSKFQLMRKHFYQGAEGLLLIFDLTNPKSFESITKWYEDIKRNLSNKFNIVGCIFGNKVDLKNERKVDEALAKEVAKGLNLLYIETSALTGQNVENAFYQIAKALINLKKYPAMNN